MLIDFEKDVCDGDEIILPNGNRGCTDCPVEFDKITGQVV